MLNMTQKQIPNLFYLWPVVVIAQGRENLKVRKEITNCRTHIANDANDQLCGEFFYRNVRRAISAKRKRLYQQRFISPIRKGKKFCKQIDTVACKTTIDSLIKITELPERLSAKAFLKKKHTGRLMFIL